MRDPASIHVRIGKFEFDAEGDPETINRQFDDFIRIVRFSSGMFPNLGQSAERLLEPDFADARASRSKSEEDRDTKPTIYQEGEKGQIIVPDLKDEGLPTTAAILMLLLGYEERRGEGGVTGYWLIRSLEGSGYDSVGRIEAHIDRTDVEVSGQHRGKRYRLTKTGSEKASHLLEIIKERRADASDG